MPTASPQISGGHHMMNGSRDTVTLDQDYVPIYGPHAAVTKWLTQTAVSHRRILSQDVAFIWDWCQQNAIPHEVLNIMLIQLSQHCGAGPSTHDLFVQEGLQLVHRYSSIGPHEQLRWALSDLSARQAIQKLDSKCVTEAGLGRLGVVPVPSDEAVMLRLRINGMQIEQLMQLLSNLPANRVAETRVAMHAGNSAKELVTSFPATERVALAQACPNVPSHPIMPSPLSVKRKRENPMPTTYDDALANNDYSDTEDALQGQADALNARIAAIRARTTQEDLSLLRKKIKRIPSKTVKTEVVGLNAPHVTTGQELHNKNTTNIQSGAWPMRETKPAITPPASAVKLVLRRLGKTDYRCKASSNVPFSKIMAVARKEFGILPEQEICLHLDGQRLSAAELVGEAALQELSVLNVFDLSPTSTRVPTVTQRSEAKVLDHNSAMDFTELQPTPCKASAQSVVDLTSSSPPQPIPQPCVPPPNLVRTEPVLCQEQQDVVDAILAGQNVFYTGSAGCGKSTVLKAFVPRLRDAGKTVRIVAPTGKAALDINGTTTWTFAGWTPGHMKKPLKDLVQAAHGKFVSKRFRDTDVLVIDEISMVENHLLARLNHVMKAARGDDRPFGGVQVVATGDFCQLPPVKPFSFCMECGRERVRRIESQGETLYKCPKHGDCNDDDKWAFRSTVWEECKFKHVNLSNIHRQSDQVFIGILQKLRIGVPLTDIDRKLLLDHPCDVKNATKLFPTREEVRRINQTEFDKLRTAKREYRCLDLFRWNEQHGNLREKGRRSPLDDSLEALREHRLDNLVNFKAGMLVVLLVNLDISNGLVNGSQGRVIGFEPYAQSKLPKAAVREGEVFSSSSRGSSSKKPRNGQDALPDPSQAAARGELRGEYAALREGQIKEFILQPRNQNKMWPIVEFDNGLRRTIYADCQVNELGDEKPYTLLARTQIPLLAAWAMTIHKSQGMTLNRVIVDLGRSFEEGQEYVALSRARSLDGLKVTGMGDNVGKGGNEQVKQFLKAKFNIG